MEIIGLPVTDTVRPPIVSVDKEHYTQLEKILTQAFDQYPKSSKQVLS